MSRIPSAKKKDYLNSDRFVGFGDSLYEQTLHFDLVAFT